MLRAKNKRDEVVDERPREKRSLEARGAPYGLVNLTPLTRKPRERGESKSKRARERERKRGRGRTRVRGKCVEAQKAPTICCRRRTLQNRRLIVRIVVRNALTPSREDWRATKDAADWCVRSDTMAQFHWRRSRTTKEIFFLRSSDATFFLFSYFVYFFFSSVSYGNNYKYVKRIYWNSKVW